MDNEENNIEESLNDNESVDDTESAVDSEDGLDTGSEDYSGGYQQPVGYSPNGGRRLGRAIAGGLISGIRGNPSLKEKIEKEKSKNKPPVASNNDKNKKEEKNSDGVVGSGKNNQNASNGESVEENREEEQNESSSKLNLIGKGSPFTLKFKLILLAIAVIVIFLLFFVFIGACYIVIDKINDSNDDDNISGYTNVGDNSGFWWPVGSNETTTKNGKLFAGGTPALTSISSGFTSNRCLDNGCNAHYGIDVGSGGLINVYNLIASKAGTIVKVSNDCEDNGDLYNECNGGVGNYVTIDHGSGYYTRYQHMAKNSITVSVGDSVEQGQVIGKIGQSGRCQGAHLHFQVHIGGTSNSYAVDPTTYVDANNPRPSARANAKFSEGSDVKQSVCLTLKNAGFDNTGVAAVLGNMYHESNFNPSVKNYLGCLGLTQWCFGRKDNLLATYGNNWTSVSNQMEYLLWELNGGDFRGPGVVNYLKTNHSAGEKSYYYCMHFEVPGESECRRRIKTAEGYTDYVNNGCN